MCITNAYMHLVTASSLSPPLPPWSQADILEVISDEDNCTVYGAGLKAVTNYWGVRDLMCVDVDAASFHISCRVVTSLGEIMTS